MTSQVCHATIKTICSVTYRGTVVGGGEAEIRLHLDAAAATLADAWARLTARYGKVDPESIEIELREAVPAREKTVSEVGQLVTL